MAFRPPSAPPDFSKLRPYLVNSGLQQTNNALYQTIDLLIQWLTQLQSVDEENLSGLIPDLSGLVAILTALIQAEYLTWSDQSAILPNSRNLIAGTGILFDDTVVNERTISASGGAGTALIPAVTGAEPLEWVSDGAGQPILVYYNP